MAFLALVGAVVGIDIAAKVSGHDTITAVLRRNRLEASIGLVWLTVHVMGRDRRAA